MTTKPTRFRKRNLVDKEMQITPRPTSITSGADRGQALRNWLDVQRTPILGFAKAAGVSRATLNNYLTGTTDLAYIEQKRAAGIIESMGVTDWDAWEILGIPEDARETFRTFRPHPWGHGRALAQVQEIHLVEPMLGELNLPAGALVRIDPSAADKPIQVLKLDDGRFYSVNALLLSRTSGEHLGGLVSVHF